jgi:hypothetical protein
VDLEWELLERSYDIVTLDLVDFAPCIHDPSIVRCDDGNDINTLALKVTELLDVRR